MKFGLAALFALASTDGDYTQDDLEEHCVAGDPLFREQICQWYLSVKNGDNNDEDESTATEELSQTTAPASIQTIQARRPDATNGSVPITATTPVVELSTNAR